MKAFVIPQRGTSTVELAEVPVPEISDGDLLVRVQAVGVGIHDSVFLPGDARYPYPIGIEAAGQIEKVGRNVTGYRPGDRIAFVSSMQPKGGTWAEYAVVTSGSLITPIPDGLGSVEAAAIPVAGNTVLRALKSLPAPPVDGSLFVAGGSGAIGTFAIQLATSRGWRVAASASAANHDYLLSLGAHRAVDYRDVDWQEQVLGWMPGGVDAAIAVQPGTTAQSLPVVKDDGSVLSISGDPLVSERRVHVTGLPHDLDVTAELARLMEQVVTGEVRLELEHVYPFDDALLALTKVQTRHARGKVVLRLE